MRACKQTHAGGSTLGCGVGECAVGRRGAGGGARGGAGAGAGAVRRWLGLVGVGQGRLWVVRGPMGSMGERWGARLQGTKTTGAAPPRRRAPARPFCSASWRQRLWPGRGPLVLQPRKPPMCLPPTCRVRPAVLLLVPLLRRLSDPDPGVRAAAAGCFGGLMSLLPLAQVGTGSGSCDNHGVFVGARVRVRRGGLPMWGRRAEGRTCVRSGAATRLATAARRPAGPSTTECVWRVWHTRVCV